jgi:hypothetical protein
MTRWGSSGSSGPSGVVGFHRTRMRRVRVIPCVTT